MLRAGGAGRARLPCPPFRLARPLDSISLMDVVAAVEGPDEAFRCAEIRRQGPGGGEEPPAADCAIAHAMGRAELAWRRAPAAQTLDEIRQEAERQAPGSPERLRDNAVRCRAGRRDPVNLSGHSTSRAWSGSVVGGVSG
ncbi:Rrf2 family transcriptional regulator [Streptomyces sp. NBC_01244]|uniref:Rrf2 family transcriptional regulator n=1 Tax=Streptomyces sp. NBC_01244 TaxID=2903797 RepID=UPI002E0F20FC|nr:Rrf2 family transcriptional regulator [Streptomyces sp. NBC_01244]